MDDLKKGMSVKEITGLPSEYSYLDSKRVTFLQERFAGAQALVVLDGGKATPKPVGELKNGQEVCALIALPPALGWDDITEEDLAFFKGQGFHEFKVKPLPSGDEKKPGAVPEKPPAVTTPGEAARLERVTDAKVFLEQVGHAEESRESSAKRVEDMFNEGRADRHATEPAMEAVEDILNRDLSHAMSAVAGLKASDQTYTHCVDMAVIFHEATAAIIASTGQGKSAKVNRSTLAAGFMHDIGKSRVPREILDSTARFGPDSREMKLIRSHVTEGAQILSDAGSDNAMINVAHFHHVKKDTSLANSYPAVEFDEVMPLTRLAAIVDVYQALIGKRSYKRNWVPGNAVRYLKSLRGTEFDEAMMDKFLEVMGLYPVGSLVSLSTGDKAFVVDIKDRPLEKPVVVVTENAQGETFTTHPLIDLAATPDISIAEVVDHYEHYGDDPDTAFRIFVSLNVI